MAINFIQYSGATATDGAMVAVDLMATFGTASEVSIQIVKIGYGTAATTRLVATGQPFPVSVETLASAATQPVAVGTWTATGRVLIDTHGTATIPVSIAGVVTVDGSVFTQPVAVTDWTATQGVLTSPLASATQPVSVGTWTATGQVLTSPLATATQPVSVGTWTATGQVLTSPLASATQPVSVGTWTATGQVLTSPLATATQPVSVGTWTATGEVRTVQDLDTATDHNVVMHPFGPYGDQVTEYLNITATTVATLATAPGTNNFNDLVALFVSNHATSPQSVSIRETSTATLFNPMLAGDGGGFIWQPVKPTRQVSSNNAWTVQTSAATGIKLTAEFQTAT